MFWFELSAGDAFDIVVITNLSSEGTVRDLQAPCRNWVAVLRSCWCCFTSSIDRHLAQDTIEVQDLMCDCIHT